MNHQRDQLLRIYHCLLDHFGPRHWWPADTTVEMVIGAILTQNVAWKNVVTAIDQLKPAGLLDIQALAEAPKEQVAILVRSTRYYNQKADRLQAFARLIVEEYGGELENLLSLEAQELRRRLLAIKGIGKETADCIILYGAGQPIFVVDAYTRRVFSRLGFFSEQASYDQMQAFFTERLAPELKLFQEYHAQIDCLGNRLCLAKSPSCALCPLGECCAFAGQALRGEEENAIAMRSEGTQE
ncbi:endonuclease III domain-containing protein [Heliobacterium gestii]|uniref:Endonuclease III domain-containing protein n=1 Tax=Heliomicrobium gestii TaxID=2699 RepID=A0A845LMT5_HELGE|nr:endonuclease III domain-containing protein [Heliomicrobium gestii]MBM7868511.1 endonuclease-3 related protein [Heliomicrobium gestii]MZP44663.1 endonuclease III domain-containing protein [Heliomicrobium gestii]